MKLKKILKESKLSPEQKQAFVEAVSKFNEYGNSIYRENNIKDVVEAIKRLSSGAGNYIMSETESWFDGVTVKRDVKEINNTSKLFEKAALEMESLQQRLESLYEDLGGKLGRYYELAEKLDPVGKEDGDIDNDGDQDASDEFLAKKRAAITKAINNESVVGTLTEGFATWSMQFSPQVLGGVTLDPKKVYKVKARSTVEAIKKASKAAGIKGDGWMATQTHKLTKIG